MGGLPDSVLHPTLSIPYLVVCLLYNTRVGLFKLRPAYHHHTLPYLALHRNLKETAFRPAFPVQCHPIFIYRLQVQQDILYFTLPRRIKLYDSDQYHSFICNAHFLSVAGSRDTHYIQGNTTLPNTRPNIFI